MNFEQAKALRIQQWRDTLDNHDFRMQNPEAHRSSLLETSARLVEESIIDRLEQFEMDEMANAAYWLAVEELHTKPVFYRQSYGYDVIPKTGGPRIGTIFHSILRLDASRAERLRPYDGQVYQDEKGLALRYSYASTTGRLDGMTLTLDDGQQFDLVETERMVAGVVYQPIDDPDVYRWMLDVMQVALEGKHLAIMKKVRPFFELARFFECPACLDRFGKREDCAHCAGLGFVEKPRCPGKLPEQCKGQPNTASEPGEQHVRRS
ncbi:hypothetical protein [Pseudomonas sp. Z4-20]|uniref:hypothetical protein n=1 Tax=Pseudomonas sp. Z4-20 TaxID=2817414 RepID=UPI003DA97B5F